MILIILSFFLVCGLVVIGVIFANSSGKPIPYLDVNGKPLPGSVSEKVRVNINGVEQGMFIKSKNIANPVLLVMHGGPGMPEYFLNQNYPSGLEDIFTVCWWERRGAGLSYSADISPESMTMEQMVADTIEVTQYLRNRFGQEKIYLMAHSGGSIFGLQAVQQAPELFHAYIGMGQMVNQIKSENLAFEYMLDQAKQLGNTKLLRRLEAAPPSNTAPLPMPYMMLRDDAMHTLGVGSTREMRSVVSGIFLPIMMDPEYTFGEKMNIWRGKTFSSNILWDQLLMIDMANEITKYEVPIYFFSGKYDYTVSYQLAKEYYGKIQAPVKGFYTFENSAHSPVFEEPAKTAEIMRADILQGLRTMADADPK